MQKLDLTIKRFFKYLYGDSKYFYKTIDLINHTAVRFYSADAYSNSFLKNGTIWININDDNDIGSLIVHELGHLQYLQSWFNPIVKYNNLIIQPTSFEGYYWSDKNEIRQRVLTLLYQEYWGLKVEDDLLKVYDRRLINKWKKSVL